MNAVCGILLDADAGIPARPIERLRLIKSPLRALPVGYAFPFQLAQLSHPLPPAGKAFFIRQPVPRGHKW